MKHTICKSTLTHLLAIILLVSGSLSASAQYYMNIYPKNGQKVRYVIADLDSINFSDQSESSDDYEYVDLGLSVNWATHNVGAGKFVEDYGDYYAWGETETKSEYTWGTYKYSNSVGFITKYCVNGVDGYNGFIDNKTTLDPMDDVAHVKWGGVWRMPTNAELEELYRNCNWEWTIQNGIKGYRVTSILPGYTDRSIFLPAAGTSSSSTSESFVSYWTSSLDPYNSSDSKSLYYDDDNGFALCAHRYLGCSVRPVTPSVEWASKELSYKLNKWDITIYTNENDTLRLIPYKGYENVSDIIPISVQWVSDNPTVVIVSEDGVVTGVSEGTASISALIEEQSYSCLVTVNKHKPYVDMGLSVLWATFNVGATVPEEYGDYYSWGGTEPMEDYSWVDHFIGKSSLGLEEDAAHIQWRDSWRMPTNAEMDELHNNCTWTWTTVNGVNGYLVTSNITGYTDHSIFLPVAGYRNYRYNSMVVVETGYTGLYWSSSSNYGNTYPYYLRLSSGYTIVTSDYGYGYIDYRNGLSVRPVLPSEKWLSSVNISFVEDNGTLLVDGNSVLKVIVMRNNEVLSNPPLMWSSDNPSVAVVDGNGVVTALSAGTAHITASIQSISAQCTVTVTDNESEVEHEYVDLGLSVKWATFNVGALSPKDIGAYYSWSENDVAHAKWGGNWRMPTKTELDELRKNCTWTWYSNGNTEFGGVAGYKVSSNREGFKEKYIFLPATGYVESFGGNREIGLRCCYWSSTKGNYGSYGFRSDSSYVYIDDFYSGTSITIRPVCPSETWLEKVSFSIDNKTQSVIIGYRTTLTATVKYNNEVIDREVYWTSDNPSVATVNNKGLVTGVAAGTTKIIASCLDRTDTCVVTVVPQSEYEYVDLGLSVNWATFNVGANNPWEYGLYYAWGEIEPKEDYSWYTYQWCYDGWSQSLIKYNKDIDYEYEGFTDNKSTLESEDDVAHVKWGGNWRMPTTEEQNELVQNCTWTWYESGNADFEGVAGYKVTSNKAGYTDRSIFLPATGMISSTVFRNVNTNGYYWSSSLAMSSLFSSNNSTSAQCLSFDPKRKHFSSTRSRNEGLTVRPVCQSEGWLSSLSLYMNIDSTTLLVEGTLGLNVVAKQGDKDVDKSLIKAIWSSDNPVVADVDQNGMVIAKSAGTANIIASFQSISTQCTIKVIEESNVGPEYVDLGLSVKWATFNIGGVLPEDFGYYFAWGETDTKDDYSILSYKWCNGSDSAITKYNTESSYGTVDNKAILEYTDDVANVKWGGSWRIPTEAEQDELRQHCTWTWTTMNGVNGYLVTSNITGYTDRSIFLPAAGIRTNSGFEYVGSSSGYWSSSLLNSNPYLALALTFYSRQTYMSNEKRFYGLTIRPVCP